MPDLITTENYKTKKGEAQGWLTGVLYLAPNKEAGGKTVCPNATAGCKQSCLFSAGRGAYWNVQAARIRKTKEFQNNPNEFIIRLDKNVEKLKRKAGRLEFNLAIRLNGTSDIFWEILKLPCGKTLFEKHKDIKFYDYTKNVARMKRFLNRELPKNYHLTFSRSETNDKDCIEILAMGGNVAYVFSTKRKEKLPRMWNGIRTIDGDLNDIRFINGKGKVIGLRAKGRARKDKTGFVIKL